MKQGGLIIAGLVLLFAICIMPVSAEARPVNYETYMVEDFNSLQKDIRSLNRLMVCRMQFV
jgi:hypothetical protein